jgi:hypothetical protein
MWQVSNFGRRNLQNLVEKTLLYTKLFQPLKKKDFMVKYSYIIPTNLKSDEKIILRIHQDFLR